MTPAKPFYRRLLDYYARVAQNLRIAASSASMYPNSQDIGDHRERTYEKFLEQHLPAGCCVLRGGFLFELGGRESAQIDILIAADTALRFGFPNDGAGAKSFACVDGTLAVVSVKSKMAKRDLLDCFRNIASIPQHDFRAQIHRVGNFVDDYYHWPLKIIFAYDGLDLQEVLSAYTEFFEAAENRDVPDNRRPDIIHILGKTFLYRIPPAPNFALVERFAGGQDFHSAASLAYTTTAIQTLVAASKAVAYDYRVMPEILMLEAGLQHNEDLYK